MKSIYTKTAFSFAALMAVLGTDFAQAQSGARIFTCNGETSIWRLYESAQSHMFEQDLSFIGPGNFTLTTTSDRDGRFEILFYSKENSWDKWKFSSKVDAYQTSWTRTWTRTWEPMANASEHIFVQIIAQDRKCRDCKFTMQLSTANCPVRAQNNAENKIFAGHENTIK